MRVAALTGGTRVPSARLRVHQHRHRLEHHGIRLDVFAARFGSYPPASTLLRPWWLGASLLQRVPAVVRSRGYDVTLLQREMISTLATLEGLTGRPRVLDVDDALWTLRGGRFVERIAARCDAIVCGNDFLAEYFSRFGSEIAIVPTAVDTGRYAPLTERSPVGKKRIGWVGTSSGHQYLYAIEDALTDVLAANPNYQFRVISDRAPSFRRLPPERVEFVPWHEETEPGLIRELAVGIMPLRDSAWERGKCSYKMLLYMACGVPVVVSPVGMNRDVLALGSVGHAATTREEWVTAMLAVLEDDAAARALGLTGRQVVERHFAAEKIADELGRILGRVAGAPAADARPANDQPVPSRAGSAHGLENGMLS